MKSFGTQVLRRLANLIHTLFAIKSLSSLEASLIVRFLQLMLYKVQDDGVEGLTFEALCR
jgi:hypothetical protein